MTMFFILVYQCYLVRKCDNKDIEGRLEACIAYDDDKTTRNDSERSSIILRSGCIFFILLYYYHVTRKCDNERT